MPEQLGHQQAAMQLLEQTRRSPLRCSPASDCGCRPHCRSSVMPSLRAGVAAEEIALQHAVAHDVAALRVATPSSSNGLLASPRGTSGTSRDLNRRRENLLAQAVQQERGLAIQAAAAHRSDEVPEQAGRDRCLEQAPALASSRSCARPRGARNARRRAGRSARRRPDRRTRAPSRTSRRAACCRPRPR